MRLQLINHSFQIWNLQEQMWMFNPWEQERLRMRLNPVHCSEKFLFYYPYRSLFFLEDSSQFIIFCHGEKFRGCQFGRIINQERNTGMQNYSAGLSVQFLFHYHNSIFINLKISLYFFLPNFLSISFFCSCLFNVSPKCSWWATVC